MRGHAAAVFVAGVADVAPGQRHEGVLEARRAGPRAELLGGAAGKEAAVVEDDDVVAALRFVHVMRGDEDRAPALGCGGDLGELVPDGAAGLRVEADGGLVEDQDGRIVDQRARDLEAPLHAAGERADDRVAHAGEADPRELLLGSVAALAARDAEDGAVEVEVLAGSQPVVERRILEDDAARATDGEGVGLHVVAIDEGATGARGEERREDLDGGALAGAVGAEQREERPGANGEVERLQRMLRAERARQRLGANGESGLGRRGHGRRL